MSLHFNDGMIQMINLRRRDFPLLRYTLGSPRHHRSDGEVLPAKSKSSRCGMPFILGSI